MKLAERAKIFIPFTPLEGYTRSLLERQTVRVPDRILSPDQEEEIDRLLHSLVPGDGAEVLWYRRDGWHRTRGTVREVDVRLRRLLVEEEAVPFGQIRVLRTDSFLREDFPG